MKRCLHCGKDFRRLASHLNRSAECQQRALVAQRSNARRRQQETPFQSTQEQSQAAPAQQQSGNSQEQNDIRGAAQGHHPPSLFLGIDKCPRCHKELHRPLAHFNHNSDCYAHYTQIAQSQIQQTQNSYYKDQQNHELLDLWINTAPIESDDDDGDSANLGFATVATLNSQGKTVARRTSTRSVSSRMTRKKRRRIRSPRSHTMRSAYDGDDESEPSQPNSSISTISSVALIGGSEPNSSFLCHPELDNTSMLHGYPKENESEEEQDGGRPAIGTTYNKPVAEAIANLPHLDRQTAALVELYDMLHNGGAPLRLFDDVVAFIEKHAGRTFGRQDTIPRRGALLKKLASMFKVPKAEGIPVAMETGNEELAPEGYQRVPRHTIVVQRWRIAEVLQEYLLDVQLFGNERNLVNVQNPFGKYQSANPINDKELIAGVWYRDTYDSKISNPSKEFLLVIELYLDKTGRTAALGSYCGEPVIMSSPLLNQDCRQHWQAWRMLGLIEDMETSSSAKKTQQSGREKEKGRTARDYHKILFTILQELIEIQKTGGICLYVRMLSEIRYLKVIPVISVVTGDAKSGDTLCCRFLGKNCLGRVPRLCMTPFSSLDNPMISCRMVRAGDLLTLHQRATDEDRTKKERKAYRLALTETSTHLVNGALYHLDYGSNDLGVTFATATDMMHCFESGIIPRLLKVFAASMTTSVKVEMDKLVEKLFIPIRSTCKKDFLRFKFKGGATSLTMLNSHHWPGMAFTFLVVLLTDEGASACASCFSEEDTEEPDYDWDVAPPVNLSNIYVPPILEGEGEDENVPAEIESCSGSEVEGDYSVGKEIADGYATDVEAGTDDELETARRRAQELSDSEDEGTAKKAEEKKKKQGKKKGKEKEPAAKPMKCSIWQFRNLLEELLCFHAWYKVGLPPIVPTTTDEEVNHLQTCIRKMIARLIGYCPRNKGNGWKLQKLHELLHLILNLLSFCHSSNFDAGRGERLLKDFFKDLARNSQQRGQQIFTEQLAKRMYEKQLIQKAMDSITGCGILDNLPGDLVDQTKSRHFLVGSSPSFVIEHNQRAKRCSFRWLGENKNVHVHPVVLSFFAKEWESLTGNATETIDCYTEFSHKDGNKFRAHPNYRDAGPWYDWAVLRFVSDDGEEEESDYPCRILLFYKDPRPSNESSANYSGIRAVVQATDELSDEAEKKRKNKIMESHLCRRWLLYAKKVKGASHVVPCLYSVDVESIQDNVLVIEEEPGLCETWEGHRYVWTVSDREARWPLLYPHAFNM